MNMLDVARFTTAQTAAALGITPGALMAKLHRGGILLADDETPQTRNPGTGRSRLFTARRVLHLALTEALLRVGLSTEQASRFALDWTDSNASDDDAAGLVDEAMPATRAPGELYANDRTIFRVLFDPDGGVMAVRVDRQKAVEAGPLHNGDTLCACAVLVDLNDLRRRTLAALGLTP